MRLSAKKEFSPLVVEDMKSTRFMMFLLSFLLSISITNRLRADEKVFTLARKIWPSIVTVSTYDQEGRVIKQEMGFFVGKEGDVISNRNLLKGAYRVEVKTINGMMYPARKVVAEDREADLIRVGVEIPSYLVEPLPVISSLPHVGERVFVMNRFVHGKPTSGGIVSAISEIPGFGKIIQLSAMISSEVSGSPVVNRKGEVVGIVTFRRIKGQTFNSVIPGEKILKLKSGKGKALSEWEEGREEVAEEAYATGLPFLWKGDYKGALTYFKEAAQKDIQYPLAYFQIGYCHAQLGQPDKAIEAYKKAIQVRPDFVLAHFFLGLAYIEVRDRNDALEEYKVLKDLDEDYASDLYNMIY
jgi:hypothetical protein